MKNHHGCHSLSCQALYKRKETLELMDSVDVGAATSTEDNKRRVNKKNRDWPNRLHLRPPTMQSEDKHGPKKIVELERCTMWPSSKKARTQEEAHERPCRTINGGNSLRFKCSQCKDNVEYTPKDLVGHFEEKHRGISLVLSCHMCTFITHEFSYLQVHLLSHMDTLSCCSICKDNVQRTWSEFSTHLTMVHTQNGKYTCEMCNKFSTGDDREFLEHILLHNLGLNRKSEYTVDRRTTQTFLCQHCGYEASQKMLNKHIKATHGHLNCSQRNQEVHSYAMKPNEAVPKSKPRLTRSAVKEMCWLTQDCLSLPGREFLDKYCHLPDAQTTLEETEQFLRKSGEQKWTKALKTVFSNVPQDMTLHPKAENGLMSNSVFPDSSQDVTVLTVQNKITLAENGATYPKRLKMTPEKDPEGANADSCDKTVSDTNFNDCLQTSETKPNNDVLKSQPPEGPQMQENRENHRLKTLLNIAELNVLTEEAKCKEDGIITNELKAIHYTEEKKPVHKAIPKKKRKNRRWKKRSKQAAKHSARALKIVFKKSPETGKQWVTQSALSPTKCNSMEANEGLGKMDGMFLAEKLTKALKTDVCEGQWTTPHKQEAEDMTTGTLRATNTDENRLEMLEDGGHTEEELDSSSVNETKSKGAEKCPEPSEIGLDLKATDEQKTPRDGSTEASPEPRPVITPQSEAAAHLTVPSEPAVDGTREGVPADAFLSSFEKSQSPPTFVSHWKPAPKNLERTLKIVAINPNQLVKRPAGDQPIVVLNHPDADIPEVARIMEVINRYKGEVHKVVLSKRTLNALSAINGEALNAPPDAARNSKNSKVQERFLLKLKLRRLSRKKFEVVPAESSQGSDTEKKFRCWFCGRVFENREIWSAHRQRHLMEWKSPNCENS